MSQRKEESSKTMHDSQEGQKRDISTRNGSSRYNDMNDRRGSPDYGRRSRRDRRHDENDEGDEQHPSSSSIRSPLRHARRDQSLSPKRYDYNNRHPRFEGSSYGGARRYNNDDGRDYRAKPDQRSQRDYNDRDYNNSTRGYRYNNSNNNNRNQYYSRRDGSGRDFDERDAIARFSSPRRIERRRSRSHSRRQEGLHQSRVVERRTTRNNDSDQTRRMSSPSSKSDSENNNEADLTEDQLMNKLMGVTEFNTTKGKVHSASDLSGINKKTKRRYRQYMNRRGGFNRPLSPVM